MSQYSSPEAVLVPGPVTLVGPPEAAVDDFFVAVLFFEVSFWANAIVAARTITTSKNQVLSIHLLQFSGIPVLVQLGKEVSQSAIIASQTRRRFARLAQIHRYLPRYKDKSIRPDRLRIRPYRLRTFFRRYNVAHHSSVIKKCRMQESECRSSLAFAFYILTSAFSQRLADAD